MILKNLKFLVIFATIESLMYEGENQNSLWA